MIIKLLNNKYMELVKVKVLISAFMFVWAGGMANAQTLGSLYNIQQQTAEDLVIQQGADFKQALNMLEYHFNVVFLYRSEVVEKKQLKRTGVPAQNVERALEVLLEGTGLHYKYLNPKTYGIYANDTDLQQLKIDDILNETITGRVVDAQTSEALPGVNVVVDGTLEATGSAVGTTTDMDGFYEINVPEGFNTIVFTYIGYETLRVNIDNRIEINVELISDVLMLEDLVVVGYGTQRRSDLTGSVASVSRERLDIIPNQNIAQAMQGAVPGIMIQTTSSGAVPTEVIMIRGRNSILASNTPLIVVDGVPYGGNLNDISPNDVQSIEVLKDASAAAVYGSRGANGVILVTTKRGSDGTPKVMFNSRIMRHDFIEVPEYLDGGEFFDFKMVRRPDRITASERAIYESGEWTDWLKHGMRDAYATENNISVSGGFNNTTYYISGGIREVQGLLKNDDYQRIITRLNLDSQIKNWITIGTRTQLSFDDQSGANPSSSGLYQANPLTSPFDEFGNIAVIPWPEDTEMRNPLEPLLFKDRDISSQLITNNYLNMEFPFINGLNYRINVGYRERFRENAQYRGMNTQAGIEFGSRADLSDRKEKNTVIENILSYTQNYRNHRFFATAVYSYENDLFQSNSIIYSGFPNDYLTWYAGAQATSKTPNFSYSESSLISQMLRFNYVYDNRYLLTFTTRRDGFSGFGPDNKWGIFPSIAIGWNLANEDFFPWKDIFSELKPRISYGLNGNQAVNAYQSMTRLGAADFVAGQTSLPGYSPSALGQENLGWESSKTLNAAIDFGLFEDRISGEVGFYHTNTTDLLLNRLISPVHGISSITQNIGETENSGFELLVNSWNIVSRDFNWNSSFNLMLNRNEILSLYGFMDEHGREMDDVGNAWFIGKPIRVNYDYVWDGTWQLHEAEEAAFWGTNPGFIKIRDVDGDGQITAEDRQIIGQQDPKFIWGLSNTFSYRNIGLSIFIHGVHGVTKQNPLLTDYALADIRFTTFKKNWWTPDNPTNDWVRMDDVDAERMAGIDMRNRKYQDASFIRIKDVALSYNLSRDVLDKFGLQGLQIYVTGRNLKTFTEWNGLDPELNNQRDAPLQRELVIGINLEF